ncbi:MAG: hypothetical protein M1839_004192 [Geoglossum umbratile]|nr:MAG: hypothetical protein M1839_004192 [Geoglossum umbratile]
MAFGSVPPPAVVPKVVKDQETGQVLTYRAQWARLLVREQLALEVNILQTLPPDTSGRPTLPPIVGHTTWSPDNLPRRHLPVEAPVKRDFKLCIVGAGMAGLYIAYILDTLAIPGVSFDFLEASDRIGGRCFTHEFSKIPHDYYDVGAMRFPRIPVMDRTFDLFKRTGTETIEYYYNTPGITVNCPILYNDVRLLKPVDNRAWANNPFKVDGVPNTYITRDPDSIMTDVMAPYVRALNDNPAEGFKRLMLVDHFSTRGYLSEKTKYKDYTGIEYVETLTGSTNSFDGAFSEAVIESIDFAASEWRCIEGGVEVLAKNVWRELITKPQLQKKVTSIAHSEPKGPPMIVKVEGEREDRRYDTVFCTPTLGCIQKMDLRKAKLNWGQKSAIRGLAYGPATKVAIKFSRPWWITDCGIAGAGIGSTDEPLRTCVYPSYNLHDGANNPAVLLCSYAWQQDALRIGSLIRPNSPEGEDELKELMLQGLARLHNISYDTIKPLYITHHAWDWYQNPYTMGAYADFNPAQFSTLYPYLSRPAASGLLHFAGEAMSAHHAWIVGALESGYRAVDHFLEHFQLWEERKNLRRQFGSAPPEMEAEDGGTEHLQVLLGSLSDEQMKQLEERMPSARAANAAEIAVREGVAVEG